MDDPRNTDNAWIETKAYHIHLPRGFVMPTRAGGDADGAAWIDLDPDSDERYANLCAKCGRRRTQGTRSALMPSPHAKHPQVPTHH